MRGNGQLFETELVERNARARAVRRAWEMRGMRGGPSEIWLTGLRGGLAGACGDMPAIGEMLSAGDPRTRDMAGGLKLVPTVWAQRAMNAWYAAAGVATRLRVDGVAGSNTYNAAKDIRLRLLAQLSPIPDDVSFTAMPQIVDAGHIAMPAHEHDSLLTNARIADPAGSTVALCNWDPVPSTAMNTATSSGGSVSVLAPSGTSVTSSPITASGDFTSFVGGSSWLAPLLAFGGAAVMGLGATMIVFRKGKRGRR